MDGAGVELLLLLLFDSEDGAGEVELLLLLFNIDIEDGAGEVELLQVLLFDIVCGATEVDYYSYSYLTLKVEQLVRFGTFVAD